MSRDPSKVDYCKEALRRVFIVPDGSTIEKVLGKKRPRILGEVMTTQGDRKAFALLLNEIRSLCDDVECLYEQGSFAQANSQVWVLDRRARSLASITTRAFKCRYPATVWSRIRANS